MPARRVLSSILVAFVTFAAVEAGASTSTGDATTGTDAGNTLDAALLLPSLGSYQGGLKWDDVDWYRAPLALSEATCVEATFNSTLHDAAKLVVGSASGEKNVTAETAGNEVRLAVAYPGADRTFLGTRPAALSASEWGPASSGGYTFSLASMGVPPASAGDAGTGVDAGSSLSEALLVDEGCFGGRLTALSTDSADVYKVAVPAGEAVYYSIAGANAGLELAVLDSAGGVLGYVVSPGDLAGLVLDEEGVYYLSVSSSQTFTSDSAYVIGLRIGPDPPGAGCRPACML